MLARLRGDDRRLRDGRGRPAHLGRGARGDLNGAGATPPENPVRRRDYVRQACLAAQPGDRSQDVHRDGPACTEGRALCGRHERRRVEHRPDDEAQDARRQGLLPVGGDPAWRPSPSGVVGTTGARCARTTVGTGVLCVGNTPRRELGEHRHARAGRRTIRSRAAHHPRPAGGCSTNCFGIPSRSGTPARRATTTGCRSRPRKTPARPAGTRPRPSLGASVTSSLRRRREEKGSVNVDLPPPAGPLLAWSFRPGRFGPVVSESEVDEGLHSLWGKCGDAEKDRPKYGALSQRS